MPGCILLATTCLPRQQDAFFRLCSLKTATCSLASAMCPLVSSNSELHNCLDNIAQRRPCRLGLSFANMNNAFDKLKMSHNFVSESDSDTRCTKHWIVFPDKNAFKRHKSGSCSELDADTKLLFRENYRESCLSAVYQILLGFLSRGLTLGMSGDRDCGGVDVGYPVTKGISRLRPFCSF